MGRADQLAAPHLVRIPNDRLADKKIKSLLSQAGIRSTPLLPHVYHHLARFVGSFFIVDSGSRNTVLQIRENIQ